VGKPLDAQAVVAALQGIYALGVFTRVDFSIEERDGRTGLVVHAEQQPGDDNRLRLGVTIAATDEGRSDFDLSVEWRLLQLDGNGSEARFVGVLGSRTRFSAEYFKVLDSRQRWFVEPSLDLQNRPVGVFDADGFRLGEYDVSYGLLGLAVGRQFGGFGEARLGLQAGLGEAERQAGVVTPETVDLDLGQVFASLGYDTLDSPFFPTHGLRAHLDWTLGTTDLGDVADYQKAEGAAFYAFGDRRNAFILNVAGGDAFSGALPLSSLFTLGGPFNFPGYGVDELSGGSYGVARFMYRRRLIDNAESLFNLPLYAGFTLVGGNIWPDRRDVDFGDLRFGGNVYLAVDTLMGPLFLAAGAADDGRAAIYLFVGRPF
jgi:NTE family protein